MFQKKKREEGKSEETCDHGLSYFTCEHTWISQHQQKLNDT